MLATMATVTTGLMSPNSYGLKADQVAAKMAAEATTAATAAAAADYSSHYSRYANSSDSEQETVTAAAASSSPQLKAAMTMMTPKRNKRKNFKPRCSTTNVSASSVEETAALQSEPAAVAEYSNNNNLKNVRRRKTMSTRKLVLDSRYSPMDLSKNPETDSTSEMEEDDEDEETTSSENDNNNPKSIPSSFSIRNLSKPHIAEAGQASTLTTQGLTQGQVSEMREYAMNTMRELLGIYGLTSEVAESISRQLPIAAFSSGKILENLTLGPPRSAQSPPSQPPTPPSTPLSPRSGGDCFNKYASNSQQTSSSTPIISSLPQNLSQRAPLNLVGAAKKTTNGAADYGGFEVEKRQEEDPGGSSQNSRGIFPPSMVAFSGMKREDQSSPPPPPETNPLNAMMAQSLVPTAPRDPSTLLINKTTSQLDYSKYVKKFASSLECGSPQCKDLNYREHFHCLDCNSRVFIKKEEMIRHFKWHKKRDESLQHGFMRYSPLDDCSDRYTNCTHNKKQTHYHCIKEGCDKVYISTSDVQMHANYHRKDSAIIQEGFQRYRATEECGASYCAFFGQRTTHFHCRRTGCRFTFKNKSDMEKHKSYHIKDEQLSRDGFKKFMKNESCPYENCRFSKVCNHIHCIRPQCNYVLHSSGQLFSHKRKHERKDSELAYRKYKLAQSMMKTLQDGGVASNFPNQYEMEGLNLSVFSQSSNVSNTESLSERNSPVSYGENESVSAIDLTASDSNCGQEENPNWNGEDFWRKYCQMVGMQDPCVEKCEYAYSEHYHCMVEGCEMVFNCRDGVREHARNHEQQEQVTECYYTTVSLQSGGCDETCIYQDKEKHYHCNWDNCREVILPSDKPFRRLEHYKMHEYSRKLSLTKDPLTMTHLATSIDGMFCRKRGRPPKNRVIEVWNDYSPMGSQSLMDSPQAIFTSFKLPKPSTVPSSSKDVEQQDSDDRSNSPSVNVQDYSLQGFDVFQENSKCPDNLCPYLGTVHYHCNQNRCLYVTDKEDVLIMHSKDFHDNIDILDGFEFYDRNVDCRLQNCPSNKVNRHFHCTRCNYSFVQYSTMSVHNQKHLEESKAYGEIRVKSEPVLLEEKPTPNEEQNQFGGAINLSQTDNKVSVVKASGTFYPLSTIPTERNISPNVPAETTTNETTSSNTLYGPELSCSRPFCKLKRKYHYHCNACNQAFSEMDRLLIHVAKHSTGALNSQYNEDNNNQQSNPPPSSPIKNEPKINVAPLQTLQNPPKTEDNPYLNPAMFDAYSHFSNFPANLATQFALMSQQNAFLPQGYGGIPAPLMFQHTAAAAAAAGMMQSPLLATQGPYGADNMTSPLAAMAANLNKRALSPHEMSPEQKKARIQNSMRILKDEPVPDGYLRFRFNEDCQYQHCGYREHQTHFHCQRQDCGYSFCDKTRFVQHTARHERLDTLMGGDFQQYRANVACGRSDCAYTTNLGATQNKASHFHCLKCDFVCTDTNKVVAHRRQHQKLDSIQAAGFEKFTPSQHCRAPSCQHSGKQTHYHCLSCQYAVLGLAQMSAHKYRHMEG